MSFKRFAIACPSAAWLVVALSVAGCGANLSPVLNVQNAPVTTPYGAQPSPERTRAAILQALTSRRWTINEEGAGYIVTTVQSGGHMATARIDYNATSYSINYVNSSPSLGYDGARIHRRYNRWIDRLRKSIDTSLAQPGVPAVQPPPPQAVAQPAAQPAPEAAPAAAAPAEGGAPAATTAEELPPPPPPE